MEINDLRELVRLSFSLLASPLGSQETWTGEPPTPDAHKPAERTRLNRLLLAASFLSFRFGAGVFSICLITEPFWHRSEKPKNLPECFSTLFWQKNAFCDLFLTFLKNPPCNPHAMRNLQTAPKRAIYMTLPAFASHTESGHFMRNLLKINLIGLKNAQLE